MGGEEGSIPYTGRPEMALVQIHSKSCNSDDDDPHQTLYLTLLQVKRLPNHSPCSTECKVKSDHLELSHIFGPKEGLPFPALPQLRQTNNLAAASFQNKSGLILNCVRTADRKAAY